MWSCEGLAVDPRGLLRARGGFAFSGTGLADALFRSDAKSPEAVCAEHNRMAVDGGVFCVILRVFVPKNSVNLMKYMRKTCALQNRKRLHLPGQNDTLQ